MERISALEMHQEKHLGTNKKGGGYDESVERFGMCETPKNLDVEVPWVSKSTSKNEIIEQLP